uniref:polygalacturonase-like isoform X2 n=1 Tax=Fragaria vesca subsp. vesca TaxID=101020 RepID=UPI0005C8D443|nr:PREDICTED: polygalacturonase-like isoform X2 [Fragaria vesca subsp. vesca]
MAVMSSSLLLSVLLVFSLSSSCYGSSFQENSLLHSYVDDDNREETGFYGSEPSHPSYMSIFENPKFSESNNLRARLFSTSASVKQVSVDDFGAKGNGAADDTQAFVKAWKTACSSTGAPVLLVPKKSYLVKPITFSGPCKSQLTMQIYGTIEASGDRSVYSKDLNHWIMFDNVKNLLVQGPGTINGNGQVWWKNSCKRKETKAVTFYKCNNLVVKNLKFQDAQQMHVSFEGCTNVQASYLTVTAPETSPNTDGIHITSTKNMTISNSNIGTGDDCISIVSGSQNVQASSITCGPGHGISIGSLGKDGSEDYVSKVTVNGAKFSGTTNGVRIKTWQGGSGMASNIAFQNIEMKNVYNPIIIDQNYCDTSDGKCKQQSKAVKVRNVLYQNIRGTSASQDAITFDCSKSIPCQGIVLQNVQLNKGAECSNVNLAYKGNVSPRCA